ncbi:MAG: M28 family peptidase [Candidatus Thermoplasmatota archaeon]|nr:M28 family peptidase [Candidatus Thermoplasmatota archaeon]
MGYEDQTHAELGKLLKDRGISVPRTKQERIAALIWDDNSTSEASSVGRLEMFQERFPWATAPVIAVVVMLIVGGGLTAILFGDSIFGFFSEEEFDGELIDFDPAQTRAFAEGLVALGHSEWGGRMSGTAEEYATAQSNLDNFSEFGLAIEDNSFSVPMFEIQEEPQLSICMPGIIGFPPCAFTDVGSQETVFTHRSDFVLQGYSGSADYQYQDQIPVVDLGNASDNASWESASASIGLVFGGGGVSSNTQLFLMAQQYDLYGLILVTWDSTGGENPPNNCKIPGEDGRCVPFFKSVDTSQFENMPPGIPFMMVSDQVGELIRDDVANGEGLIRMIVNVDNQGEREVKAPCGILPGQTDELIIFGGHHDTVYNGPGAVDDTSGTASVLELARQFANMAESKGEPYYTMKFCTWGGEEEGLHGSKAFVASYLGDLQENLRLYINLDMNHVDIDLETRGNSLWMFGNDERDMKIINQIVEQFNEENPRGLATKYTINTQTLDGAKNSDTGMPYNSDHGPFVYDIQQDDSDERGRAIVCYGSGSWEYHTYRDNMDRFNEESLAVSGIIYGSYAAWLAWG